MDWYNYIKFTVFQYSIFNLSFWLSGGLMFLLDYFKLSTNYKTQKSNEVVTYKKCFKISLRNSLLNTIPAFMAFSAYDLLCGTHEEESVLSILFQLGFARIASEVIFYVIHRGLHTNFLYKCIHKLHHEIVSPVGISALYMTFLDLYIGNIFPLYIPFVIMGSQSYLITIWMIGSTISAVVDAHGGLTFFSGLHDTHHKLVTVNYGTGLFMDKIFGTSQKENLIKPSNPIPN